MIVLIGQNHDDVLYYENVLRDKKELNPLFGVYPMISGVIFNQDILLVYDCVTSYVTGLVVEKLIQLYNPHAFIMFGRCKGVSFDLKNGHIVISKRIVPVDVDQCEYFNVKVGEIPNIGFNLNIEHSFIDLVVKCFESANVNNYHVCTFLSANTVYSSVEELSKYGQDTMFLGKYDTYAFDSDCISPLIVCKFHQIPFISIKIVDSMVGEDSTVDNFVKTLGAYAKVGKSVTSFIGEIGRKDILS